MHTTRKYRIDRPRIFWSKSLPVLSGHGLLLGRGNFWQTWFRMKVDMPLLFKDRSTRLIVLAAIILAVGVNSFNLHPGYFSGTRYFLAGTIIAFVYFLIDIRACMAIAAFFKKRLPEEREVPKRITLMILAFLVANLFFLLAMFNLFEAIPYFDYRFDRTAFIWSYFALGILIIFITLLSEGISRYNEWQLNRQETEKLAQAYAQSQIHALKSQVNPHFLFNSLNALSSLIQDDEEMAEKFLDEMSKVYRYMLRNEEEQLVTLDKELKFLGSYIYLLKTRYGDGLQVILNIREEDENKLIAPMALQVLIENAFTQNQLAKSNPLIIAISSDGEGSLRINHKLQPKTITGKMDFEDGLDNLIKKYGLLNKPIIVDDTNENGRSIVLPLVSEFNGLQI